MRIVPSTKHSYARIEWDRQDQPRIQELQKEMLSDPFDMPSLKGLQIELSEHDVISEDKREALTDGRFFRIE